MSGFSDRFQPLSDALLDILFGGNGASLVDVLSTYQNEDGGFGHGLEADIQMPLSNVASTDMAFNLLRHVTHESKFALIQRAIGYYETVYDSSTYSFEMVSKDVDSYPHAIWWNYADIGSFTYGNPNPEIAGTLLQYNNYVTSMKLQPFVDNVLHYITTTMESSVSMHSLLSALLMYQRVEQKMKEELRPTLQLFVDRLLVTKRENWNEYGLEPYKVYLIAPSFLRSYQDALEDNICYLEDLLDQGPLQPNWQWFQYEDVFEVVKEQWSILLTFDAILAVTTYRKQ